MNTNNILIRIKEKEEDIRVKGLLNNYYGNDEVIEPYMKNKDKEELEIIKEPLEQLKALDKSIWSKQSNKDKLYILQNLSIEDMKLKAKDIANKKKAEYSNYEIYLINMEGEEKVIEQFATMEKVEECLKKFNSEIFKWRRIYTGKDVDAELSKLIDQYSEDKQPSISDDDNNGGCSTQTDPEITHWK